MYLSLSIYVLFISPRQRVNETQFLNTTCITLFPLPGATFVIVPLTSIYASL